MKNLAIVMLIVFSLLGEFTVSGQNYMPEDTLIKTSGFYIGGQAATSGFGLNFSYMINKRFTLKSGFETLQFNKGFSFDENDINYQADLNYKTGGIFLLADYFYAKSLYFSAGVATNSFNPNVEGEAISELKYGDIKIPASEVGDFKFNMEPALKLSPYAGVGFQTFFGTRKRVVYNMETGFYYIGSPKINIDADGLLAPTADPAHGQKELLEKQFQQYKFYPILKFNIAVKLF